jgi:hypothetical protein
VTILAGIIEVPIVPDKRGDHMKKFALLPMMLLLLACEQEGPLERAGEEIDEAVEDIRAGGETTENQIDDAIDDVREELDED